MKKKANHAISTQKLTMGAMLAAVSIILGIVCKNFLNFGNGLFRITFENFPIILSGILFGPVSGAIVGAVADITSYILSTQTLAISPLITLGAASVGAVSGFVSHYLIKKDGIPRLILSTSLAHLVGSIIIKSIGLYTYYGSGILVRVPLYFVIACIEGTLIILLYQNKSFQKLVKKVGDQQ